MMRLTIRTSFRRFASHQSDNYFRRDQASHGFHLRQREIAPSFSFRQFSLDSSSSPGDAKKENVANRLLKESPTISDADLFVVFTTLQKIGFNENYLPKESTDSMQQSMFSLLMKFCAEKENYSFLVERDLKDFFSFLKANKPHQKDKINSVLFYKTIIPFLSHFLLKIHETPSLLRSRESLADLLFHLGGLHLHYHQFKLDKKEDFSAILVDCFDRSLQSLREEQSSNAMRLVRGMNSFVEFVIFDN
jgi:hypothetical protein